MRNLGAEERMRGCLRETILVAGMLLLLGPAFALAAQSSRIPEAHYTDDGQEACMRCHAGENMQVILETAHGDRNNPHAPFGPDQAGCEACHGPGSLHVSRSRGGAGYPPLARFGRGGDPVPEQLSLCLGCHEEAQGELPGMAFRGSLHDTGRMTCSSCHTIHASGNPLADRQTQIENCARCHADQIEAHDRFEGRGILFDRLTCHDCHDAHQLMRRE